MIAADGGVDRALALGLHIDLGVGDFDSVSPQGSRPRGRGCARREVPGDKDATDLELALDAAVALPPARIVVVGSHWGPSRPPARIRSAARARAVRRRRIDAFLGTRRVHIVRGARTLDGHAGRALSLMPVYGAAEGVTTQGLVYPLGGETLPPARVEVLEPLRSRGGPVTLKRGFLPSSAPARTKGARGAMLAQKLFVRCPSLIGPSPSPVAAAPTRAASKEVVLVTHDSFAIPKGVKAAFERETGLKLRIFQGGDAGESSTARC